jgi:transcriptional regulator with XRE-family HTH domain
MLSSKKWRISLGRRLQEIRKENHMTLNDVASDLGIPFQKLSRWENGTSEPSGEWYVKLSKYYRVALSQMLPEASHYSIDARLLKIHQSLASLDEVSRTTLLGIFSDLVQLRTEVSGRNRGRSIQNIKKELTTR